MIQIFAAIALLFATSTVFAATDRHHKPTDPAGIFECGKGTSKTGKAYRWRDGADHNSAGSQYEAYVWSARSSAMYRAGSQVHRFQGCSHF